MLNPNSKKSIIKFSSIKSYDDWVEQNPHNIVLDIQILPYDSPLEQIYVIYQKVN